MLVFRGVDFSTISAGQKWWLMWTPSVGPSPENCDIGFSAVKIIPRWLGCVVWTCGGWTGIIKCHPKRIGLWSFPSMNESMYLLFSGWWFFSDRHVSKCHPFWGGAPEVLASRTLTVRPWKVRRPQEQRGSSSNHHFSEADLLNFQAVSDQLSLQLLAIIFSCVALGRMRNLWK